MFMSMLSKSEKDNLSLKLTVVTLLLVLAAGQVASVTGLDNGCRLGRVATESKRPGIVPVCVVCKFLRLLT